MCPGEHNPMPLPSLLWALVVFTCSGSSVAQKVTQDQTPITAQEGSSVSLKCQYDTNFVPGARRTYYLYWYKELPDGKLILLIEQPSSGDNVVKGRYSVNLQKSKKSITLGISSLQQEDSAKYLCAIQQGTVFEVIVEAEQKPSAHKEQGSCSRVKLKPHLHIPYMCGFCCFFCGLEHGVTSK